MKRSNAIILIAVLFLTFSCASTRTYDLLEWDSDRFKVKDGRLFNAVKGGSPEQVRAALTDNPNINVSDRLQQTAFMWACWNGNLEIIDLLLSHDRRNIEQKTKKYQRLDIKAESDGRRYTRSTLGYNALFCYVMSRGINPFDQKAKDLLKTIIDKDPSIFDKTDFYGETVIHKLIRSNNDYYDVITTGMNADRKRRILNQKSSRYQQSPLRLAVELGNRQMVSALSNEVKNRIVIDDFSNDDLPLIAFNSGNGDLEIFLNFFIGKIWDDKNKGLQPHENKSFDDAVDAVNRVRSTNVTTHSGKVTLFIEIYNRYKNGTAVNDPDLLVPAEYTRAKTDILNMAKEKMSASEKKVFFEKLSMFPEAVLSIDVEDVSKKSLVQYIIERQDADVFEDIFKQITDKLPRITNGFGDYLTIAMLSRKTEIMHFLLNRYPVFQSGIDTLMYHHTNIAEQFVENVFNLSLMDPLQIFCISDLSRDRVLLEKMARFYQPRFPDNHANLSLQLVENEEFEIFDFFLDNYGEYFYNIKNINTIDNRPILAILFDKQETLAYKIVNYCISTRMELGLLNEGVLSTRNPELWTSYQRSRAVALSTTRGTL